MIQPLVPARSKLRALALASCLVLLAGCQTPDANAPGSSTVTAVSTILNQVQTSVSSLQQAQTELATAQAQQAAHQQATSQFVADRVDEARYANKLNPQQNGATGLVESNLAPAASVSPPPSADVKQKEIDDLTLALSHSADDQKVLQARNDALLAQANQLNGQTQILSAQVAAKEAALTAATHTTDTQVQQLASADAQVKIQAAAAADARNSAEQEAAAKARISIARWFMLAGGLFLAAGIVGAFLHVPEVPTIGSAGGVTLLVVGWLITYLENLLQQAWFRFVLDAIVLAGIGALVWIVVRLYQHRLKTAAVTAGFGNLVGAIQEAANDDLKKGVAATGGIAAKLQPYLQQWHLNAAGKVDQNVINAINETAASLNVTNPGETAAATGAVATAASTSPASATPAAGS